MWSYFFYVLLVLIISSCGSERHTSIPINLEHQIIPGHEMLSNNTQFSTLLEEYRYIIPETNEESLFAYIYKAYIYRDCIFILDKKFQDKILVFDLNDGKFIIGIGNQGGGPNEYTNLGNFTLDKNKGDILILDEHRNSVIIYDAVTGIFKSSFNLNFTARNIEYVDENILAYAGGGQYMDRLYFTDFKGEVLDSYIASNEKNWVVPINSFSRGTGNEIVFRTYLTDSLYTLTPQGPVVSRFIDFGNDALTWERFNSYSQNEKDNIEEYLHIYRANIKYYSETDSHIWFIFSDKNTPCCTVYNKETSDIFNYSMFITNDIIFDGFAPLISASDEGFFIGANDALSIKENVEQLTSADVIPEGIKSMPDDNNPVITLLKFKK